MFLYEPPEPPKKATRAIKSQLDPKGRAAVKHIARGGVPINPDVLHEVKRALSDQTKSTTEVLTMVESDPGLLLGCLRNYGKVAPGDKTKTAGSETVMSDLQALEHEKLQKLVDSCVDASELEFERLTSNQVLRYQHWLVSTTSAKGLAGEAGLDGNLAYLVVALKQLGLSLVAWNYPSVYSSALLRHRKYGVSVEDEIKNQLGVAPLQLMEELAQEWGLSSEIRRILNVSGEIPGAQEDNGAAALSLVQVCELSELIAKSKDTKNFPSAASQLEQKRTAYEGLISDQTWEEVETKIEAKLREVLSLGPLLSAMPLAASLAETSSDGSSTLRSSELFRSNLDLQRCPEHVQRLFEPVYSAIEAKSAEGIAVEALKLLVDKLIPRLGYRRGCLFMLDYGKYDLAPALRVGDVPLAAYDNFMRQVGCPVRGSVSSNITFKSSGLGVTGASVVYVCSSLALGAKEGVLYLELAPNFEGSRSSDVLLLFHAIRQTFSDIFGRP